MCIVPEPVIERLELVKGTDGELEACEEFGGRVLHVVVSCVRPGAPGDRLISRESDSRDERPGGPSFRRSARAVPIPLEVPTVFVDRKVELPEVYPDDLEYRADRARGPDGPGEEPFPLP